MTVTTLTADHVIVVQAAHAYRSDEPAYAETLLAKAHEPMTAALELVGLLMVERAQLLEDARR